MNEKRKVVKHIIIMSILGIVLSGSSALVSSSAEMLLVMGILPLVCSVAFLITKHPVFGIIYSVLFGLSRILILQGGTLLAIAVIVGMLIYFIYVDRISYQYHKKYKRVKKIDEQENA